MKGVNKVKYEKIKIFFISVFPPPYRGVGVWNERILKILGNKDDIELTVYSIREKKFLKKNVIAKKIAIYKRIACILYMYRCLLNDMFKGHIGFKEYLSTSKFVFKMCSILTQVDAEKKYCLYISHTNLFTLAILYVFELLWSTKIILHEHGSGAIEYAAQRPKVVEHIFNKVDSVIVASNYMKEVCINDGCENEKICVLPCGIDFTDKPYVEKENIIMFCGSLEQHKDPISFIKAIPIVLELLMTNDIQFALIGEGSLRGKIEEEVNKLGIEKYVKLYGELTNKEVLLFYQKAKIFVLPSIREPFGIVIIEAISNYIPCIVTNIGGMPEIVDSSFGKIVNVKSPEQIAYAIVEIMKMDDIHYKEMSIMAYNASKSYDMNIVGELFYKLFKGVYFNEK